MAYGGILWSGIANKGNWTKLYVILTWCLYLFLLKYLYWTELKQIFFDSLNPSRHSKKRNTKCFFFNFVFYIPLCILISINEAYSVCALRFILRVCNFLSLNIKRLRSANKEKGVIQGEEILFVFFKCKTWYLY